MIELIKGSIVAFVTVLFSLAVSQYTASYSIVIAGVLALLCYFLLDWIVFKSPLTVFFRKKLYPYSDLEGYWLQRVGTEDTAWERPWSVSCLKPKGFTRGWIYEGTAYDQDHAVRATWHSSDIYFDPISQFWIFKGKSKRHMGLNVVGEGNVLSILYWANIKV